MNTPTPTGNGRAGSANRHSGTGREGNGHADRLGKLSPWMPDSATLTRLAGDVLANLAEDSLPGLDTGRPAIDLAAAPPSSAAPDAAPPSDASPDACLDRPSFYFIDERPEAITGGSDGSFPRGKTAGRPPSAQVYPRAYAPAFDVEAVRADFPILGEWVDGRPLVWLDNAATTQKPRSVIDRITAFYTRENSNIHRGAHTLAARATDAYEEARSTAAEFLGAPSSDGIIFTRGTTESINLVAQAWGRKHVGPGDEIVLSQLEHHANIVPWQQLANLTGARLRVIPTSADGELLLDRYAALLNERTKLVAVSHVSNVLGTIVPVGQIAAVAHQAGAKVLVDGAQAVAHLPVRVQALEVDFYAFSGHKVFGPTGVGALYAKPEILATMPPWQGGGNMISDVTFERTRYQNSPAKFEAGTGSIADVIGLGAALDYVTRLGLANIGDYEHQLLDYATAQIATVPGLRLIGTARDKASVLTFVIDGLSSADVSVALDRHGIAVRSGHHCAQPILRHYGLESAVRPSLAMYNTRAEVDLLVAALNTIAASAR
jgi:cysteine desulfurase / selenocysteine lyase